MKDSINQQTLRVAYDQTLDQISISQGHKVVSHKHAIKFQTNQKECKEREKAAKMPTQEEASEYFLKSKQDQLGYLIASTLRIEKGLATLTQNQESLERIMEQKFYDLDVKVSEI